MVMKVAFGPTDKIPNWKVVSWKRFDDSNNRIDVFAKTEKSCMEYIKEELTVWDTDSSGTENGTVGIKFDDGSYKFYSYTHSWYWSDWDDPDSRHVANEFSFKKISREQANIPVDRDWLDIGPFNYRLKKWPQKETL